jgi:uncharacterized protein YggE
MNHRTLATLCPAALVLVAGCSAGSTADASPSGDDGSTIRVAGSGSAEAEPNRAVVRVSVVATADDAATARQRLAANASRMRTALNQAGIDGDQITTTRYDIYQDRRRPREEGDEPLIQYRAMHGFEVTVTDTDDVGTVVDTAVSNGATEIEDIRFTLTAEQRRELERDARQAAMADARSKARSLADSANLTVTGVAVIRTTGGGAPRPYESGATATETAVPDTDRESGPVTVVTSVEVVYEAAPADGDESGN